MIYDIIFLSYKEPSAEENWQALKKGFPWAQRVHNISGIHKAHAKAFETAKTDFFFIVDGDNWLLPEFNFAVDFEPAADTVYVWRCKNPVNDLVYGYGGVKLYHKSMLSHLLRENSVDIATSLGVKYFPVPEVASITNFNTSAFDSWRSAFREGAKLQINLLKNPKDLHSEQRLKIWCDKGEDRPFGRWCQLGARSGKSYILIHQKQPQNWEFINNFDWLQSLFSGQSSQANEATL